MKQQTKRLAIILLLASGIALAGSARSETGQGAAATMPVGPPMERTLQSGLSGKWWRNPETAQKVGLTPDQQKKMDDVFQQNRP